MEALGRFIVDAGRVLVDVLGRFIVAVGRVLVDVPGRFIVAAGRVLLEAPGRCTVLGRGVGRVMPVLWFCGFTGRLMVLGPRPGLLA